MRQQSQKTAVQKQLGELAQQATGLQDQLSEVRKRIQELRTVAPGERYAVVERSRCTGCGLCEQLCPVRAIRVTYVANIDAQRCTGCGVCVQNCPQGAVHLATAATTPATEAPNA